MLKGKYELQEINNPEPDSTRSDFDKLFHEIIREYSEKLSSEEVTKPYITMMQDKINRLAAKSPVFY